MAAYVVDSSALVKRYVTEIGSAWTTSLLFDQDAGGSYSHTIFLANITLVEVTAALARRHRGRTLSQSDYAMARAQFRREAGQRFLLTDLTAAHVVNAMTVAEKHALRGYDAVQLAVALALQAERSLDGLAPLIFVSADNELLAAAHLEGLPVGNPNLHP